jgi:chemotaxis protein CheD
VADVGAPQGLVVGVADLAVGREANGRIVTYALGSCIGLTAWDPVVRGGGMLHYMLPQPPEQYDPKLLRRLGDAGAQPQRLVVCAAGGAEILEGAASLAIGKRNRAMLRKVLWRVGTALVAEDTGGAIARTMTLDLGKGEVHVRSRDNESLLWAPGMRVAPRVGEP